MNLADHIGFVAMLVMLGSMVAAMGSMVVLVRHVRHWLPPALLSLSAVAMLVMAVAIVVSKGQ